MTADASKTPLWFWIVSGLALAWNLLGLIQFFVQVTMSKEVIAKLPEAEQALYANIPLLVTIGFAMAVFGGTAGCILLLLRRKWAFPVLIISLIGVIIQFGYTLLMTKAIDVYGVTAVVMPGFVVLVCGGLIWLSHLAISKGWLK